MRIASCCGIAALLASCAQAPGVPEPPIRKIAEEYRTYGRVSDRLQWAPTLCRAPSPAPPRPSVSRDPETHGKKLYYLYAKNFEAYRTSHELPQPVGQVLVKEAWLPAATSTSSRPVAGERAPLFVMMKT